MTVTPNHIGFTVRKLDRSIEMLRDCFGFTLVERGPRPAGMAQRLTGVSGAEVEIAFLRTPGLLIELLSFQQPENAGPPRPNQPGAVHLALDLDDIDVALERAAHYGLCPLGEVVDIPAGPNKGRRVVYLQDADGLTLELIERAVAS
ncbi:VOC family protein [Oceanibium sediminis]|uniref:VOC family protein n=1 Tax=Oceanibium sediminis TaxID=2026339 RepID=UPI000DD4DAA6|nr:VOC family protein [Oceanibium sediminis]